MTSKYISNNEVKRLKNNIIDKEYDSFVGIQIPLVNSQYGYFNPSIFIKDQIKTNLKHLILTIPGEYLYDLEFGCNIIRYTLFENLSNNNADNTIQYIKEEIITKTNKYLPEVNIVNIDISKELLDKHIVEIIIDYKIPYLEIIEQLKFNIIGDNI